MSLSDTQWEFLKDVSLLIQYAERKGVKMTGGELYRTEDQQQIYIDAGKSWTMDSKHLQRLAIDFNFFIDGDLTYKKSALQFLGDFWESLHPNNTWGGNWGRQHNDTPHFERTI